MKASLMILTIFLLFLLANAYVFLRLWRLIPPGAGHVLLIAVAAAVILPLFLFFGVGEKLPVAVTAVLYKVGTAWFFILLYLLMAFLLVDLLRLVGLLPTGWMRANWVTLGVIGGTVALIMGAGYLHYRHKVRTEVALALSPEKWPADRGGFKIVAVSDLHLGYGIGAGELAGWVERLNRENADLILIAGDAIDSHHRPLRHYDMAPVLRGLRARYGVYAVPGNHEYISGIDGSLAWLTEAGVEVLRDSVARIGDVLWLVGRDDRTNLHRKPLSELVAGVDPSAPVIVLDHQPYDLDETAAAGADLQFSGHTHRGQVWPVSWITDRLFENSHGLSYKDRTAVYVSQGLGIWGGKFRIGSRSEYTVITLKAKE